MWPGLTCVSLPKVESAEEVHVRADIITELERRRGIAAGTVQMAVAVETALGVVKAYEIASASHRIVSIGVGAEDLTQEMGVQTSAEGRELWYARSKVLVDAYAAAVQPMGLVGVEPFTWREPEKAYDAAVKECIRENPERYPHWAPYWPDYSPGLCPVWEAIQPRIVMMKTNYFDTDEAFRQADILAETIRRF